MKSKLLLFAFGFSFFITHCDAQVNASDSLTLVDLYKSLNGAGWISATNWLSKNPLGTWQGITVKENRVSDIYLPQNNLDGVLPSSIGNLTALETLSLGYNRIHGSLPSSVGKLAKVYSFSIFHNQLSGTIPASIGNMFSLTELNLNTNHLTGEVPASIGRIPKLIWLFLQYNELTQKKNTDLLFIAPGKTVSINLSNNSFTFNGLELVENRAPFQVNYNTQASLTVHQRGSRLSVSAGGTLSNSTYYWYQTGNANASVITADSTYQPLESGWYYAKVKNKMAMSLTLHTDTVFYNALGAKKNQIVIVPNPGTGRVLIKGLDAATDANIIFSDMNGQVRINVISHHQAEMRINVSDLKSGYFVVTINDGREIVTKRFLKQ